MSDQTVEATKDLVMTDNAEMAGKRVLVTGASGFIGAHLCARLAAAGAEVHAVSRQAPAPSGELHWHRADLADDAAVTQLVTGLRPHFIFHLASLVAGKRDVSLVLPMVRSNLLSTVNLLTAAAASPCERIVLVGSQEEPEPDDGHPVPSSPYAASKWASSAYGRMFHALFSFPVVVARIFMVYGPAQKDVSKLIPYVTLSLLRGEAPQIGDGTRPVDWIYVGDVVDGLLALAMSRGVEGKTVDLGSGTLVPISTIVRDLVALIDPAITPVFGAVPTRAMEQIRVADVARSNALLGWRPAVSRAEGLKRTAAWYAAHVPK